MSRLAAPVALPRHVAAPRRRFFVVFVAGELLLAMAIPFLAIQGYHTLLDSRAGNFVAEPTRADPGWRALVEPTPVTAVVEVDQGRVAGAALMIHHPEVSSAATVLLIPGSLEVDGVTLSSLAPEEVAPAIGAALRLGLSRVEVLDGSGWAEVLGATTLVLNNPDPVPTADGGEAEPLFAVGQVEVGGADAAAFLGRPADGANPISTQPRRQQFWNALVSAPIAADTVVGAELASYSGAPIQVLDVPLTAIEPQARLDPAATEALLREVVAYPAGASEGDRLPVRILDRTGQADLEAVAATVAALGMEVIEIGNAQSFDGGDTQVVVPKVVEGELPDDLARLARFAGAETVTIDPIDDDEIAVTVVIGADFPVESAGR